MRSGRFSKFHSFIHLTLVIAESCDSVVATLVSLLVHVLGVLLGVVLGLLTVNPVHALALGELVDLAADETGNELFGESVAGRLACAFNVSPNALEDCTVIRDGIWWSTYLPYAHGPRKPS